MVSKSEIGLTSYKIGKDFEARMRNSWRHVAGAWRLRIKDGLGSERPGDEIILLPKIRILAEHKTTNKDRFSTAGNNLKEHQKFASISFDRLNKNNYGVLFIQFEDPIETYCYHMVKVLKMLHKLGTSTIKKEDAALFGAYKLPYSENSGLYLLQTFEENIQKLWVWKESYADNNW